jgi:threonine dehydratase
MQTEPPLTECLLSPEDYLRRMRSSAVYNVARKTSVNRMAAVSATLGHNVFLKREDEQAVHSFKIRGAYQRMATLASQGFKNGVIAASAGNHAQGVAYAARVLGTSATIAVPETTPLIKQKAILALGAELILVGDSYEDAYLFAVEKGEREGYEFVHPYDHPDTIVGQGTIGLELGEQMEKVDAIFVPVGGGGLIAGVAIAIRSIFPQVRIIGVEAADANAMAQSLMTGNRVLLPEAGSFADGCSVRQVGQETFRIARDFVDEVVTVGTDEICSAIQATFEDVRALPEPAGALGLAGLIKKSNEFEPESNLVALLTGANLNFDRLPFIAERAALGSQRETILSISIPEQPGSFARLCLAIGRRSLTEFNYRYVPGEEATVFAGVSVSDRADADDLKTSLSNQGFAYSDLSGSETAKLHLRHMVGGRHSDKTPERIFCVDFPERAGALAHFLGQLGDRWNISLFHYRNHGADRGRALVGFQVPKESRDEFDQFVGRQSFPMTEQTHDRAISHFLTNGHNQQ